jgi:hypothetical protein
MSDDYEGSDESEHEDADFEKMLEMTDAQRAEWRLRDHENEKLRIAHWKAQDAKEREKYFGRTRDELMRTASQALGDGKAQDEWQDEIDYFDFDTGHEIWQAAEKQRAHRIEYEAKLGRKIRAPRITWELFQSICQEAVEAAPPDVGDRLQNDFLSVHVVRDRATWGRLEQRFKKTAETLWVETLESAVEDLQRARIPVPPVLQPFASSSGPVESSPPPVKLSRSQQHHRGKPGERVAAAPSTHPIPVDAEHTSGLVAAFDSKLGQHLGANAFLLWCHLLRLASPSERHRHIEGLDQDALGDAIGLTRQQVRDAMSRLIWTGMVEVVKPGRFGGGWAQGLTAVYSVPAVTTARLDTWRAQLESPTTWEERIP